MMIMATITIIIATAITVTIIITKISLLKMLFISHGSLNGFYTSFYR